MFSETEKLQQLKICSLFMYADGESSPSEVKYLDDIIAKGNLPKAVIEDFYTFCGKISLKLPTGTAKAVISEIDELLREIGPWGINESKTMQAQTIWTLINLGYADSEYSEAEKTVVKHLVKRWEMDPALVAELNDTAETILALTLQKEWIQTTSKPYTVIHGIIQELERNLASMFANVEISISEADIA